MNLELFEPSNISKKFSLIELKNFPFFLSCKKCYNAPEILLKDNIYIIITCPNCNIIENENLENISNYSSKWLINEISNFCNSKHEEEILSVIYCRDCNLFFCNECLILHNKRNINHDLVKNKDLKIGFCNHHNKKYSYYCNNCSVEFCKNCAASHAKENYIKNKTNNQYLDLNKFEIFLEGAEKIKKEKYLIISRIKTILESIFTEDREAYLLLNNTISDIIKEFYKDLKIEQNLIFFAKILFFTIKKINNYDDFRTKQYIQIIEVISNFFIPKEVNNFKNFINKKLYIYKAYIHKLSNSEENIIKRNTKNIININEKDDYLKLKEFVENAIELSTPLKKYILIDKIKNLNSYINVNEVINNSNNITKKINSRENSDFILSILCKYFEQKGFEVVASTKKDKDFKNIELASFISLICLGNIKKYEIWFDFSEKQNYNLIYSEEERNKFLNNFTFIISKILEIDSNDLILIFKELNPNSIKVNAAIITEAIKANQNISKLRNHPFIKKVKEKPILELVQLNPDLLDKRLDKVWKKNKNEKEEDLIIYNLKKIG